MICEYDRYLSHFKTVSLGPNYKMFVCSGISAGLGACIGINGKLYYQIHDILEDDDVPTVPSPYRCPRCGAEYINTVRSSIDGGWMWTGYRCETLMALLNCKLLGIIYSDMCSVTADMAHNGDDII